ncbi:MAG: alpha/beta hydrolase [Rhodospirillales bacterium]|nr:alpha/beta hydrolase [Rhodospirillales bacterium]
MKAVASADGTLIAYEQGGTGPNLVLVHGNVASRARWASIRPRFEEHFTVTAMDRRGRGESGDGPAYSIEREFEDVAAVVDALDAPVLLFGHSYGALCALGAAMQAKKLAGLILYEPAIYAEGESGVAAEQLDRMEALLAAGDREGVVRVLFAEVLGSPPHEIAALMSSPAWPGRVAAAHTLPRELRAEEAYRLPADRIGKLSIPVLLLLGGDSVAFFGKVAAELAKALPTARTVVMPGQQHIAMDTGPDLVVDAVLAFWRDIR